MILEPGQQTITLAHGTGFSKYEKIMTDGLQPRGRRVGNWKELPTPKDCVYFSSAYAFYYANHAAKTKEDLLLIECNLPIDACQADEEALVFGLSKKELKQFPDKIQQFDYCDLLIRARDNSYLDKRWLIEFSLETLGTLRVPKTVRMQGIAPCMIRCARVPYSQITKIILQEFDPVIGPTNYKFMGEKHRAFQQSLFERFPL